MGGLWKLAAMSAVIGAGVVVAWQAQQGLNQQAAQPPSATASEGAPDSPTPLEPTPLEPVPDALTLFTPEEVTLTAGTTKPRSSAAASVPPEATEAEATSAPQLAPIPDDTTNSIRYQRGLDFKQSAALAEPDTAGSNPAEETTTAVGDPFAASAPEPLQAVPESGDEVRTASAQPEELAIDSAITTTAAEAVPESEADPFADSAPPEFGRAPAAEPAPLPMPATKPSKFKLAAPTEAESDPFGDLPAQPAAETPLPELGAPAELPREAPPQPLPTEIHAPRDLKARSTPRAKPARLSSQSQAAEEPAPRVQLLDLEENPTPAATETPANDALQGDGQVTSSSPRGVQEPRLTIEKIAPSKAVLGQPLVYSVVVKNLGGSPASQVTVEDRIPKGARLVGTSPRAELTDKRLVWKLGTLQPDEERKISIKVIPEEEGSLGSVAKVNFVSEVAAEIVITAPQLKLRLSAPTEVKIGERVDLVFTISNTGEGDASNVILRSVLPEGLQHPSGSDLEYTVGNLPAKQTREVPLELVAMKPGRLKPQATVVGDGNVTAAAETALEILGEQLVLTRKGQPRVYVGKPAVFTNKVGNEGERPVARVKVSEVVPTGFEFVEASDGGRFDPTSRTITWTVGPVQPGDEQSVTSTLLPKSVGQFEGTVTASGPIGSVATVKPSLAVEGFPSLSIEPLGDQKLLAVGEKMTAKIQLRNRGSAPAGRVGLTVEVPEELKIVSAKGPATYQVVGSRLVFDPLNELAPRDAASYEIVVEALAAGDSRLEFQISADYLKRPVKHEEAVQIVEDEP